MSFLLDSEYWVEETWSESGVPAQIYLSTHSRATNSRPLQLPLSSLGKYKDRYHREAVANAFHDYQGRSLQQSPLQKSFRGRQCRNISGLVKVILHFEAVAISQPLPFTNWVQGFMRTPSKLTVRSVCTFAQSNAHTRTPIKLASCRQRICPESAEEHVVLYHVLSLHLCSGCCDH